LLQRANFAPAHGSLSQTIDQHHSCVDSLFEDIQFRITPRINEEIMTALFLDSDYLGIKKALICPN
jgi:hypothetical protein